MAHSRALLLLSALSAVYSSPIVARAASAPPSSTNCASPNSTYDPTVSTLFSRAANGSLTEFGRTDAGATIHAVCVRNSTGVVYVAGDFSSFGGVQTPSVASLDPATGTFSSLSGGVDGPVYALSCAEDKLWAGGQFAGPNGTDMTGFGGNVATWDYGSASWSSPPFVGLDGPVWAIDPASSSSGSSVFLGGSFSVSFAQPLYNATGVADVPSLGAALATISLQNGNTSVQTSASSAVAGFSDPSNMFCPPGADGPGSTWLAAEGQTNATITVEVGRAVTAAGIRLGNTFVNGSGTNTFRCVVVELMAEVVR